MNVAQQIVIEDCLERLQAATGCDIDTLIRQLTGFAWDEEEAGILISWVGW